MADFSCFETEKYTDDIDVINVGDIVPEGIVKDTPTEDAIGILYPYAATSKTRSTIVKSVLKTGNNINSIGNGSFTVVDIGGNCGFCRSYVSPGVHTQLRFGWEVHEGVEGAKRFPFRSNSWYGIEQGRVRVISGEHTGEDLIYLKINGEMISSFYVHANSRPPFGNDIYIEANKDFVILPSHELSVKFFVDEELYHDAYAQKGFPIKKPAAPSKNGQFFKGWYTAEGNPFDFETEIGQNTELYAHFTTQSVKITYDPKNGDAPAVIAGGKNCLLPPPATPNCPPNRFPYQLVGWKNETSGKMFDFENDTVEADTVFTAVYEEISLNASYYAGGRLVEKVPFVLSNSTVVGKEPAVPSVKNAVGRWEPHKTENLTGSVTVRAEYSVTVPQSNESITLNAFGGAEVSLLTDVVKDYLATDITEQTAFVRNYCAEKRRRFWDYQ
ncbi:MAG: InlB B-repeat-containing protein, partial [Clostridia bacterium]|nr:InlB B-repeat-containing protein [Clostridia bacterium]